jgi:hypothetical protein
MTKTELTGRSQPGHWAALALLRIAAIGQAPASILQLQTPIPSAPRYVGQWLLSECMHIFDTEE